MRKLLFSVASVLVLHTISLYAATSYFRTPLSFLESRWGTVHYPLPWLNDCDDWEVDTLGVYYQRNACRAYGKNLTCIIDDECDNACSDNDKVTRNTVSLSQLWFGKETFLASEVFAGGTIVGPSPNPLLNFAHITPEFGYNETGAALALNVVRKNLGCDKTWFVGGRVAMPIKVIEVNQRHAGTIVEIDDDFANTMVTIQQQYGGIEATKGSEDSRVVKAYRLDLLTALQLPDGTPMVEYGDLTSNTKIAAQDITTNINQYDSANLVPTRAPMYAYKQNNGIFPLAAQGLDADNSLYPLSATGHIVYPMVDEEANSILSAAGNGALLEGQFGAFGGNVSAGNVDLRADYAGSLGVNNAAQKTLFIVPVMASSASSLWEPVGLLVQNTIEYVLNTLDLTPESVIVFFEERGVRFESSDCSTGAGDTLVQLYGGKMCDCWFADGLLGFNFPTGTNYDSTGRIYQQTTGNNGHFATRLGAEGGWIPCNWLGIKLDFFWDHNFTAHEKRAAAFTGSTTRNIGPCIDARVGWDSFQAHVDFTFFSQRCSDLGWDFGYEFYAKTDDRVSFCTTTALDFIGSTESVNRCILEQNTNTQSHKVRGEIFNRWGCFEIFLGGSYIIAGRQVMKEAECHLGMKAYF